MVTNEDGVERRPMKIRDRPFFTRSAAAVRIHRDLLRERRMTGLSFWATGYRVSTVGLDEHRIRQYLRDQEKLESGQVR